MGGVFDSESQTGNVWNATAGPLVFSVVTGALTVADVDHMAARAAAARARHTRVAILTLVSRATPMPDRVTRDRAAQVTKEAPAGGTLDIVVLHSGGLWATAARAALTGIYLFSGKLDDNRVCTSLDEAVSIAATGLPCDLALAQAAADAVKAKLPSLLPPT